LRNITMIAATMPLLTIHHKTEYRHADPVAFGEHRAIRARRFPCPAPVSGSADAFAGMEVNIKVVAVAEDAKA
jgi:hypothetical protein